MTKLTKAELYQIDSALTGDPRAKVLTCPINPESLKISYSNQIEPAKSDDKEKQGQGRAKQPAPTGGQFVSKLGTKLSVTLVIDVSVLEAGKPKDVRSVTTDVLGLLTPDKSNAPPGVELLWGSFLFRGFLESVEETLDFFSPDGVALRGTLALSLTRPALQTGSNPAFKPSGAPGAPGTPARGTVPLAEAPAGGSVQGMVAQAQLNASVGIGGTGGAPVSWQDVAAANGVDDPLRLGAGQRIDLTAGVRVRFGAG